MTLYYLNPNDEPRECPGCYDCVPRQHQDVTFNGRDLCNGTGQLGNSEAPRFEVNDAHQWAPDNGDPFREWSAFYPTEPLAVEAARRALGGK